ncbi:YniB family protein [Serratia microhaemolytica]|uniref:YniB family protein n=1 Tax=Serratia microhaemolytica TaxID=2675110 RepID=UPI000FDE750F|nr:YniB family protein [Serratia microhaemolytica]
MTYQQAGRVAMLKRIFGWAIFIPALISTVISLLGFMQQYGAEWRGINAVMLDFLYLAIDVIRFNTEWLDIFWRNSPLPTLEHGIFEGRNLVFVIIYFLMFVGLALQASGARIARQVKFVRENLENQMILEQAKGSEGQTRSQLEARIKLPHHTIFLQFFRLYVLPLLIAVCGYILVKFIFIHP